MKVLIAVVSSTTQLSGVTRHAANLARCLLTRDDVSSLHVVMAEWQFHSMWEALPHGDPRLHIHRIAMPAGAFSRNLWYYSALPALAAQIEADVVHLAYPVPVNSRAFPCPTVVTLHDLYPYDIPSNFGYPKVLFNRLVLRQCLRAVDGIACVSRSTQRQLEFHAPRLASHKAVTVYNCVEPGPRMAIDGPILGWNGAPFLLCVAQHRRNKNITLALQVFRRLLDAGDLGPDGLFLLVGIEGPETARIHSFIKAAGIGGHVVFLQGISDAELHWCYGHCEMLLAPSSIEGFGLPVAEAMLHHCPVVCSDIPAFREVGGNYCHYAQLQPSPESALVEAVRKVRKNVKSRSAVGNRFSAPRIADDYLRLYKKLLGAASRRDPRHHAEILPTPARDGGLERLSDRG